MNSNTIAQGTPPLGVSQLLMSPLLCWEEGNRGSAFQEIPPYKSSQLAPWWVQPSSCIGDNNHLSGQSA